MFAGSRASCQNDDVNSETKTRDALDWFLDSLKPVHIKTFLIWAAILNSPPILMCIPPLALLWFPALLFWINIPALGLGLAEVIGKPDYDIQEFGAMPKTVLAWTLIVVFWLLVAAVLTVATACVRWLLGQFRKFKGIGTN